jgi:hypothetical protein
MRASTPQSVQTISLSGPTVKPCDRLLIVVSKFPLSFSSHVAEPFSAHSGHVTDVTNRSRLSITASRLRAWSTIQRVAHHTYGEHRILMPQNQFNRANTLTRTSIWLSIEAFMLLIEGRFCFADRYNVHAVEVFAIPILDLFHHLRIGPVGG